MLSKKYTKPQPQMFIYNPPKAKVKGLRMKKNTPQSQKDGKHLLSNAMKRMASKS